MSAQVLRLPVTEKGRRLLGLCVRLAQGWAFPDGTNAADRDWDVAAIEAEEEIEEMERAFNGEN